MSHHPCSQDAGNRGPLRLEGDKGEAAEGAEEGSGAAPAGRRTLETVSAADNIIEALDMAAAEEERIQVRHGLILLFLVAAWGCGR